MSRLRLIAWFGGGAAVLLGGIVARDSVRVRQREQRNEQVYVTWIPDETATPTVTRLTQPVTPPTATPVVEITAAFSSTNTSCPGRPGLLLV